MDGTKVAKLVFPSAVDAPLDDVVLHLLPGIKLNKESKKLNQPTSNKSESTRRQRIHQWLLAQRTLLSQRESALPEFLRSAVGKDERQNGVAQRSVEQSENSVALDDPSVIMSFLPAIQHGSVPLVTERLRTYLDNQNGTE